MKSMALVTMEWIHLLGNFYMSIFTLKINVYRFLPSELSRAFNRNDKIVVGDVKIVVIVM
jgi:hypothetical protein